MELSHGGFFFIERNPTPIMMVRFFDGEVAQAIRVTLMFQVRIDRCLNCDIR